MSDGNTPLGCVQLIHGSAFVDEGVYIGRGTRIWHFCHIMSGAVIGEYCTLGQNVFIAGQARIGNNVHIQNNVSVYDKVTLEDNVFCGPSVVFTNVINPRAEICRTMDEYRATLVMAGASIGANATVICGHTIGRYAFVGAGAVVTKDVPDYALVYGNATRIVGWMCECGEKLNVLKKRAMVQDVPVIVYSGECGFAICVRCGKQYEQYGWIVKRKGQDDEVD